MLSITVCASGPNPRPPLPREKRNKASWTVPLPSTPGPGPTRRDEGGRGRREGGLDEAGAEGRCAAAGRDADLSRVTPERRRSRRTGLGCISELKSRSLLLWWHKKDSGSVPIFCNFRLTANNLWRKQMWGLELSVTPSNPTGPGRSGPKEDLWLQTRGWVPCVLFNSFMV